MKWARVRVADQPAQFGVIEGDLFHPRAGLGSDQGTGTPVARADAALLPPVVPGKFIGLWNNFKAAADKAGNAHPEHPLWFLKAATSLAGPGDTVVLPAAAGRVVFEGELGIVIGARCKNATPAQAQAAIFGYTCVNDFTSLDVLGADASFAQWTRAKSFDGFGVLGPVIETDLDPADVTVRVEVDGRERQCYPAADMILPPARIVELLSRDMTLEPGDVIACGTSLGARPVRAGQQVTVVIEQIGAMAVSLAAEAE